jgi:cobaltochelatase CobN
MLAIFMVAAEKGFWQADAATIRQMGGELARLVAKNGLPGSGHAAPKHPMWDWLRPRIDSTDAEALGVALARAQGATLPAAAPATPAPAAPAPAQARSTSQAEPAPSPETPAEAPPPVRQTELVVRPAPADQARASIPPAALVVVPLFFLLGLAWSARRLPISPTRNRTGESR